MNRYQELWWQQAMSEHEVLVLLRGRGIAACHSLHYLQMVTEKLAKAYFWRSGAPPPRTHAGFAQFLRFLGQIRSDERTRVATIFTFKRFEDFQAWLRAVIPIAYELERLSPDVANNGPNAEYPWPHERPTTAPVDHNFSLWTFLLSARGRDLMRIIQIAVARFPEYADT